MANRRYLFWKRVLDVIVSCVGLILLSPVLGCIALGVRIKLGSPVLFRQTRTGLRESSFQLLKFRTMTDSADEHGQLLVDELRLTPFGKLLRSTSLDELPELVNILRGEMSLVGPRPLLPDYLPRYSPEQARRHQVKPGLTGWAQVNGRNATDWPKRLSLDSFYVDHRSMTLDLQILLKTLGIVIRREGISAENSETMPEFTGDEHR